MKHHRLCTPTRGSQNVMHRRLGGLPGLGTLLLVVACADQGDASRSDQAAPQAPPAEALVPSDSGAQRIVGSPASIARAPTGWMVEPEPSFVVGQVTGPHPYLFDGITGVVQLADGSVLVADSGSRELRIFGLDGSFRRSAGGAGQGPGEFLSLSLAPSAGTDSVIVYDPRQGRYTIFDESVQNFRTSRFESSGIAKGYALGHVLQLFPEIQALPVGAPGRGVRSEAVTFRWLHLDSGRVIGAEHRFQAESGFFANGGGMLIPFYPISDGAVGIQSFSERGARARDPRV